MRLDDVDKLILGRLAREALKAALTGGTCLPDPEAGQYPALRERRGCFVTLKKDGALRGCLGCFASSDPLFLTVPVYARLSALEDPRFFGNRLQLADLPQVQMDISALTPLQPCPNPEGIRLGEHGIQVSLNGRSGCFLPQVAEETGWSVEEFWSHCCGDKAGLPRDAWRDPAASLTTFTAEVFTC